MKERKKDLFQALSLILGILLLCVIILITVISMKPTGQRYADLKETDISQGMESTISYSDHMFASIGFGISIIPDEAGGDARLASFLLSSVAAIELRIILCGLLYSMMVSVVLQYFIYGRYHSVRKTYFYGILISSVAPFAVFTVSVIISQIALGLPTVFPGGRESFLIALGLLSVIAGSFALNAVLYAVKHKKLAAVLLVPAVLFLYVVSMNLEFPLYTNPTVESFEYFNETHPAELEDDYEGECYYDEGKNVIILDGVEYPPQTVRNPNYYTGWKRPLAFLFELLYAFSGNGLLLAESSGLGIYIGFWTALAYVMKSAVWIVLSSHFVKRRSVRED